MSRKYTQEEHELIMSLSGAGHSFRDISDKINDKLHNGRNIRTRNQISNIVSKWRNGDKPRKSNHKHDLHDWRVVMANVVYEDSKNVGRE